MTIRESPKQGQVVIMSDINEAFISQAGNNLVEGPRDIGTQIKRIRIFLWTNKMLLDLHIYL